MAKFDRAPIDSDGRVTLNPGRYFIDTDTEDYVSVMGSLAKLLPKDAFVHQILSGRGQIMVSFTVANETIIPRTVALGTGHWYILPGNLNLIDASNALYGYTSMQPRGFWDWFTTEYPEASNDIIAAYDSTVKTVKQVTHVSKQIGGVVLGGVVAVGVLVLLSKLGRLRNVS